MTQDEFTFHIEEYRLVKSEVSDTVKLLHGTFTWATIVSGGIWTWLLANVDQIAQRGPVASQVAWFIPLAVSVFACVGFFHFHSVIVTASVYMRQLESRLAADGLGWEAYLGSSLRRNLGFRTLVRFGVAWLALVGGNLYLAILVR